MKFLVKCLVVTFLLMAAASCSNPEGDLRQKQDDEWKSNNGKVKVMSTIAMIDDIVQEIGNGYVDHLTLIKGELDPHSYQLVKGDDEKLASAQIIFFNGLGLEHGPSLQHFLYTSQKATSLGDKIREKEPNLILFHKGQVDPHIWMDVSLWAKTIPFIVEALSKQDPIHADIYQKNGEKLQKQFQDEDALIRKKMKEIPESKRYLVTSHDAFNYFTRAYLASDAEKNNEEWQKRFAAPEGLAPESQLSTTDIQFIINHLKKYDIQVLFPESNVSQDSIRKILQAGKEMGLDLIISKEYLYSDAIGEPGSDGDTYLKMIQHNVNTIEKYLKEAK